MILKKYGVQTDIVFPMVKRGVVDFATSSDWTPVQADAKISLNSGASVNTATNTITAVAGTGSVLWKLTLSAAEMSAAFITVQIVDAATKAVEDQVIQIQTYGNASGDFPFDLGTALSSQTVGTVTTVSDKTGYTASTVSDKTGYSLSSGGVDAILDATITEPTARPAWASMTLRKAVGWVGAMMLNKAKQTSSTSTLRNNADNADIATSAVTDDGVTFTRGAWS